MIGKALVSIMSSAALLAVTAAPVRSDDDARPLSEAQIALFESDHLHDIHQATQLEYRFHHLVRDGKDKDDYVDRIALDLHPRDDGGKDVWVDFLSGEHHIAYPPLMGFHGNPILMFFLERDVNEMRRSTGGAATYFRNTLRRAFVDQAVVRPTEIERDGKATPATEIKLAPFARDSQIANASPALKDKQYRFVLSQSVPGEIYEITAWVPGESGGQPQAEDSVTFAGEQPCQTDEGPCTRPASP